jgi:hypothetical protein
MFDGVALVFKLSGVFSQLTVSLSQINTAFRAVTTDRSQSFFDSPAFYFVFSAKKSMCLLLILQDVFEKGQVQRMTQTATNTL